MSRCSQYSFMSLCLLFLSSMGYGETPFAGITEARVEVSGGMPRLLLDGQPTPPFIFFYNTDVQNGREQHYLKTQVAHAAQAGVHIYSLPFRTPMTPDGVTPNWGHCDSLLDRFIEADPEALFLLRLFPGPDWTWKEFKPWHEANVDEYARFADDSLGRVSIASDYLWGPSNEHLRAIIEHYENSPYGKRIIGWHPGAPDSELFHDMYREKGPDYSGVNQARFRRWLYQKYGDDGALQKAWGHSDVSLETAAIPPFESGRFPMHGVQPDEVIDTFYEIPAERDWIDFSAYQSEIMAERVEDWARLIKEATGGRKLSVFFYGYVFELPGSFGGHYRLQRVLECPNVDVLVSPYSYNWRGIGGPGAFMTVVDTVAAHGKLWLNEDDTRTSLLDQEALPDGFLPIGTLESLEHTLGILDRNFGNVLTRRAGTWWMDLAAAGAFSDPAVWQLAQERIPLMQELLAAPAPFIPDVALIADEYAQQYVKSDWDVPHLTLALVNAETMKTGVSVGAYSLADFLSDTLPPCKAYCFANAFALTEEQIAKIRARLNREGATAIWAYAPGYVAEHGLSADASSALVGMRLVRKDGPGESKGAGPLEGQTWGDRRSLSPRFVVDDDQVEVLGRYRADNAVSAAMKKTGDHTSIYFGGLGLTAPVLRWAFERSGAHVWARGGEVIETDGRLLMVHTGKTGPAVVNLPKGVTATALAGEGPARVSGSVTADMNAGETRWFRLGAAAGASGQTALFTEEFSQEVNLFGTGYQSNSVLPLKHAQDLAGWSKVGDDMPAHWVEQYPGNWALMLVANREDQNVFTLESGFDANENGHEYTVSFDTGAGVYRGVSQATQAGDQFVVEIVRADDTVLKKHVVTPGAWPGKLLLKNQMFTYVGDGSGELLFRIYPLFNGKVHFYGVIDHLQVFASAEDAKSAVAKRLEIEMPKREEYAAVMAERMKDGLYPSKTPKFTFPETLAEQEEALEDNPLMLRFAESRKRFQADRYRPQYHFVSPESQLNDPNGLCFWQGRWHLFYQAYPPDEFPDPADVPKRRQHWGHAVSDDLVHWRDLPYAIYPGIERMCFSGSTVVEEERVVAFYPGIDAGQMVAISDDPLLLNWDKMGPVNCGVGDSCIWKEGDTYFGLTGRVLWASKDLQNWENLGEFLSGVEGSCPNFVPIGDKHMVLSFSHSEGGQYHLGDYNQEKRTFTPYAHGWFNHGKVSPGGVHAPSAAADGEGGVINILNINDAEHSREWDQIMSVAQQLTLGEDKQLRIAPVAALATLRGEHRRIDALTLPANEEVVLTDIEGDCLDIELELDPQMARWVELRVLRSPDAEEYTSITFYNFDRNLSVWYRTQSTIVLDGSRSSTNSNIWLRPPERAEFTRGDEPLRLRVLVDRSVVEVFANDRQYLAMRVYPAREDSVGVSLRAQGQDALLTRLDAWKMNAIWPQ